MSGSLNRVQLIGHLGADPEIRTTQAGAKVVSLRLATSESWTDKGSGERRERTEWHTVVVFNEGLGGVLERFTKKGAKIFVEGQMRTRKWQHQDGGDRWSTEVVLGQYGGSVLLLDRAERPASDPDGYGQTRSRSYGDAKNGAGSGSGRHADLDDDIPF